MLGLSFAPKSTRPSGLAGAQSFILATIFTAVSAVAADLDLSKLPPPVSGNADFRRDIQPILEKSCLRCHCPDQAKGKLLLDSRDHALKGGQNGPVILPGQSANSPLIHFTARLIEDSEMPPVGKGDPLTAAQVGRLRAWIDQGADWPDDLTLSNPSGAAPAAASANLPPPANRKIDFVKDIQPIFSTRCYSCHSDKKSEAQFRLDAKSIALSGGELGPAILVGNSADSLLIQAVAGLKPDLVMPKKGERLSSEQISLLRAWIDQGADWPDSASVTIRDKRDHWAFKAPVRPAVPALKDKSRVRNPIDNFVFAKLDAEKLKLSPEADRSTLVRRLSLDLVGLPPSIKETDEFVADKRPDAWDRTIERLLASPHYGERWGRHWLDAARYADTNGYEKDKPRSIWPYRDWVIKALNDDMPFDQFTIEQLAGDLLPNSTASQKIATGFLRNSMLNQEGGIEPEQFRVESMIDRMDTVGKAFLGLTVNCCQCHNHKYDPLPQKDYYQLYAFLNNDDEAFMEVPTPQQEKQRAEIRARVAKLEHEVWQEGTNLSSPPLADRLAAWESKAIHATSNWTVLDPSDWSNFATKFEKQDDHSLLGGGDLQPGGVMRVWVDTQLTNITGFRLEALTNPNLMYGGPGLVGRGSFLVKEFEVEAWGTNADSVVVTNHIKFRRALADMEAPGFSVANAIDGKTDHGGWCPATTPDQRNQDHRAVFECDKPINFPGGTRLLFTIHENFDGDSHLDCHMLGSFRLSATSDSDPLSVDPLTLHLREITSVPLANRNPDQQFELFNTFRLSDSAFAVLNQKVASGWTNWPYPATTLILQQRPQPRITHIFKRGDRLRAGDEVHAEVPSILNPFPADAPRNRLGLARWIVDPHSPTTARVIVNRIWQEYFGQGLVTTPEDFGTRVEAPSHPELLDWLACEFMNPTVPDKDARPWSLKHIHRLIANSATYRQSSHVTPELYEKDQYNRLLARGPRVRVEGEVVQDIALSVSGLLNPKIGGPSVYPAIPGNIGDTAYGGFSWPESKGEDEHRRGLYTYWKRSLPFPTLTAFDAPTSENSCPRRNRSNTPLQALTTLNEKSFVEAAQALALRVIKEGGSTEPSRVNYGFQLCTGRKPAADETDKLLKFWQAQYNYFEDRSSAAASVALPDPAKIPPDVNLHKLAAWAMASRAMLNLDETITKE